MNPLWFLRAKRWVQNPPSPARIKLVFGVIAVCIMLAILERLGFWPDWATAQRLRP
ncbi:MAG: hypothetical protein AAF754_19635 [Pseudomonadota bacterium]